MNSMLRQLQRPRVLAAGAGIFISSASVGTMCASDSRKPIVRDDGKQSLSAWEIVRESCGDVFVQRKGNAGERYKSPDGSNEVNGVPHPPFITQESWDYSRATFKPKSGDVWVATYPKCGTTFMEQIILLLWERGDPSRMEPSTQNSYSSKKGFGKVWVEASVRENRSTGMRCVPRAEFEAMGPPRLLKTHAPFEMFLATAPSSSVTSTSTTVLPSGAATTITTSDVTPGIAPGTKVVYVSRNAKDACVSSYYHAANPHRIGFPFDAWVKDWAGGLFEHGTWFHHVASWRPLAAAHPAQVLWVRYEDLKAQPEAEIRRVARFLEIDASDDTISKVVTNSGFTVMKQMAKGTRNEKFFRKGTVGDSNNHFQDPQLISEFDALYVESMQGVDDPYAY